MSDEGWRACRVCGYPGKLRSSAHYNACRRCYHDFASGRYDPSQALGQAAALVLMYFFLAMLGLLGGLLLGGGLQAIFRVERGSLAGQLVGLPAILFGLGLALWIAERLRRRGGFAGKPAAQLEMPPGASPRKRQDDVIGHVVAGALFTVVGFGFLIEALFDLPEPVSGLLLLAFLLAGGFGGRTYNRYARGRPRTG